MRLGTASSLLAIFCCVAAGCSDEQSSLPNADKNAQDAGLSDGGGLDAGTESGTGGDDAADASPPSPWLPWTPDERYAGRTLAEWAVEWTRWHLSQNDCDANAYLDPDGSRCAIAQQEDVSPMFFLAAGEYGTMRDRCVVPAKKAVLVPLTYVVVDGILSGVDIGPEEFETYCERVKASMRDLHLEVDGLSLVDLERWLVGPIRLDVEISEEPNFFTCQQSPGISGQLEGLYVAGVFVLFPPPDEPRQHRLSYGGTLSEDGWDVVNLVDTKLAFQ